MTAGRRLAAPSRASFFPNGGAQAAPFPANSSLMSSERIAFVGVGRRDQHGSRLKDCGHAVTAVLMFTPPEPTPRRRNRREERARSPSRRRPIVIITVVTDDAARSRFAEKGDSLLTGARAGFSSTVRPSPRHARRGGTSRESRGAVCSKAAWPPRFPGAQWHALSDVWWRPGHSGA